MNKQKILKYTIIVVAIILLIWKVVDFNRNNIDEQQFIYLAKSWMHGKLFFITVPGGWGDTALFNGHHYWPLGPLPALLAIPFLVFYKNLQQHDLSILFNIVNIILLFRIAKKSTGKNTDSLWLTFAFVFATAYLYIAAKPWSWYFAQVVGVTFLLLAIQEFMDKKRYALIGLWIGFAIATRLNLVLATIFFVLQILFEKDNKSLKIKNFLALSLPIFVIALGLGFYNFARFGSFFELGYSYQLLYNEPAENIKYGIWSLIHFPANIYYFLLRGPDPVFLPGTKVLTSPYLKPDIWGMSIILTSPIFLWIFSKRPKSKDVTFAWITIIIMLIAILGYYGIGVRQYGYRYAIDFYPFLYLILCYFFRDKIPLPFKIIAIAAAALNIYMIPLV